MSTTQRVLVCNKKGLHARAAAKLVKTAGQFDAQVLVRRVLRPGESGEAPSAGATSILSLLMLAADWGSEVDIVAEGAQATQAIADIVDLITRRFDEEE